MNRAKRLKIILILFVAGICCSLINPSIGIIREDFSAQAILNDSANQELKQAWALFAKAILKDDTAFIRKNSTKCIHCSSCVTLTKEDSTNPDISKKIYSEYSFIPIDKFLRVDFPTIINHNIKSRLMDKTKIFFMDNYNNKVAYHKSCIVKPSEEKKSEYKEVLVTYIDPSPTYEGAQMAFAFIKIKNVFKFCGYSTIP